MIRFSSYTSNWRATKGKEEDDDVKDENGPEKGTTHPVSVRFHGTGRSILFPIQKFAWRTLNVHEPNVANMPVVYVNVFGYDVPHLPHYTQCALANCSERSCTISIALHLQKHMSK